MSIYGAMIERHHMEVRVEARFEPPSLHRHKWTQEELDTGYYVNDYATWISLDRWNPYNKSDIHVYVDQEPVKKRHKRLIVKHRLLVPKGVLDLTSPGSLYASHWEHEFRLPYENVKLRVYRTSFQEFEFYINKAKN